MAVDIDLSQFNGLFLEESGEGLTAMESGLLNLRTDAPDLEVINMVFRAAHSIKGAARMVGLDAPVALAHAMEDVLSAAQKGRLQLSTGQVDALLCGARSTASRWMLRRSRAGSWRPGPATSARL